MEQITKIASDLNEKTDSRYKLVYEIAELAKKLVDESNQKKYQEDFGYEIEPSYNASIKKEKPVQHAIMVKASESDDSGLVG
ncbi:MAG: hypothetical protein A2104_10375 [Candidatus Melainabacteria bacterium GWF2_32_7]|nr:MAG: hypothetical protein A2104_10375 [Candidatus Melainabacteria bacterium GWF2_32_7]OGI22898.1 MAG: hypothetical protein A2255_05715 [Candidatus Melainabacteria bacterium RIFOXYA2_FULL_32_9]